MFLESNAKDSNPVGYSTVLAGNLLHKLSNSYQPVFRIAPDKALTVSSSSVCSSFRLSSG